jgi:hypothetical protein
MTRVILNHDSLTKLLAVSEPVRICDESGTVIGIYAPVAAGELYAGVDSPASEDELRQSEHDPARPLSEILRDLEKR